MKKVFYLVSNACRAKFFEQTKTNGPMTEVKSLEHRESRLRNLEISSDKPGLTHHRTRDGKRGSREPRTTPKETARKQFAREVAEYFSQIASQNTNSDLVLIAPPHFLGLLRHELSQLLEARIVRTIDKDFTATQPHQLPNTIKRALLIDQ